MEAIFEKMLDEGVLSNESITSVGCAVAKCDFTDKWKKSEEYSLTCVVGRQNHDDRICNKYAKKCRRFNGLAFLCPNTCGTTDNKKKCVDHRKCKNT